MSKRSSGSISWRASLLIAVAAAIAPCTAAAMHPLTACMYRAGDRFHISPMLIWSISKIESGFDSGAMGRNKDGSVDIGIMQINSRWLPTLQRYGITRASLDDPCTNIHVGAWILANNIKQYGYNWEAIGAYNAVSVEKRVTYARKVLGLTHRTIEKHQAAVQ